MDSHEHSVPWQKEEFIRVSGYDLVYYFDDGVMMVCFPGKKVIPLTSLLKMPVIVQEPKKPRLKELYA